MGINWQDRAIPATTNRMEYLVTKILSKIGTLTYKSNEKVIKEQGLTKEQYFRGIILGILEDVKVVANNMAEADMPKPSWADELLRITESKYTM